MALPSSVDLDRLVGATLDEIRIAVRRWVQGFPRDEVALMNHLTGCLNRRRNKCDVGIVRPVSVKTDLALLHRRGSDQTDQYGCDLAVTVSFSFEDFLKTCFLQLKRTEGDYKAVLERKQLDDAAADARIAERAFVAAADEGRGGIRLLSVNDVLAGWRGDQTTQTYYASEWDGIVEWLYKWLRCEIGERSRRDDPMRVEELLRLYTIPDAVIPSEGRFNLPDGMLPARSWLRLDFTLQEPRPF